MVREVVPEGVRTELTRAVRRWQQLPLDRAVVCASGVHALMAELAGEGLPDLGPSLLMDQLTVVVYDRCDEGRPAGLADQLASLRLSWSDDLS